MASARPVAAVALALALAPAAPAEPLQPLFDFAAQLGDAEVEAAIRTLALLAPDQLVGHGGSLVREAVKSDEDLQREASGKDDARSRRKLEGLRRNRDRAQRVLRVMRLDAVLDTPALRGALRVLSTLPAEHRQAFADAAQAAGEAWAKQAADPEAAKALVIRNSLHLDTSLRPLHRMFQARARSCFANQKVLAGAIEMYNLDFNTNVTDIRPEILLREGYLRSIPVDPGYGEGSWRHYALTPQGVGIFCTHHGSMGPPPGITADSTIRAQAEALGMTDPEFLRRCADLPLVPRRIPSGPDITR